MTKRVFNLITVGRDSQASWERHIMRSRVHAYNKHHALVLFNQMVKRCNKREIQQGGNLIFEEKVIR